MTYLRTRGMKHIAYWFVSNSVLHKTVRRKASLASRWFNVIVATRRPTRVLLTRVIHWIIENTESSVSRDSKFVSLLGERNQCFAIMSRRIEKYNTPSARNILKFRNKRAATRWSIRRSQTDRIIIRYKLFVTQTGAISRLMASIIEYPAFVNSYQGSGWKSSRLRDNDNSKFRKFANSVTRE